MSWADIGWNVALSGFVCWAFCGFVVVFIQKSDEGLYAFVCNLGFLVGMVGLIGWAIAKIWAL